MSSTQTFIQNINFRGKSWSQDSIIIIIIMSHGQHGSLRPFLATRLYRPSLLGGLQGRILYRHRAVVYRQSSCLWRGPQEYMAYSLSLLLQQCPACLVRLTLIVFVVGGHTAAVLWGVASRTCSILFAAFLCTCCQAFSPYV